MAKKKTTTVTTTQVNPQPETRIIEQTTSSEPGVVQRTTTTRVTPEPEPRVVEKTETTEKTGPLGGRKTTVKRDTYIEE